MSHSLQIKQEKTDAKVCVYCQKLHVQHYAESLGTKHPQVRVYRQLH